MPRCDEMQLRTMQQIEVQSAEEVLRDKVAALGSATSDDGPLPQVRVTMGSHAFAGVPVRIEDRRNEPWIVLVDGDEIAYVPLRAVTAVVVKHVPRAALPEPPTKLALERVRKELEAVTRSAGWSAAIAAEWPAQASEDDRRSIDGALRVLSAVMPALTVDHLGREAAAAIERITLVPARGRELSVTRNDASLTIMVGMAADLREATLRALIEKHL